MSAYIVCYVTVTDPSWLEEYGPKVEAQVEAHGGRYLARAGEIEHLEGDIAVPSAAVILEFPDAVAARAWYNSDEYAPMIQLRQSGSNGDLKLFDGL